jgi:hypothetical protein
MAKEKKIHQYKNEMMSIPELSKLPECIVSKSCLDNRINHLGWSIEKALITEKQRPPGIKTRHLKVDDTAFTNSMDQLMSSFLKQ